MGSLVSKIFLKLKNIWLTVKEVGCYYLTRIIINDVNELEEAGAYDKVS